ncbi:MAG TPA: hypothetical protein DEF45_23230 [Rhodopirellula sp.]|nr:hypothetical protein [Rhodopirellula sp.]
MRISCGGEANLRQARVPCLEVRFVWQKWLLAKMAAAKMVQGIGSFIRYNVRSVTQTASRFLLQQR